MRKIPCWTVAVLLACGGSAAAQSAGPPGRAQLVTSDSALVLQAWRAGTQPGTLESTWSARPRSVDPATWAARRGEAVSQPRDASPVIADFDGDGVNELIVVDAYGVTVYGSKPFYHAFPTASDTGVPAFAVGDVNGEAGAEVVLQRTRLRAGVLSREVEVLGGGPDGLRSLWKGEFTGIGGAVAIGDADNDKAPEILSAGQPLLVLERQAGAAPAWATGAILPNLAPSVAAVRIGDVDADGKNDVIAGGYGGKVTVYQFLKTEQGGQYGVLWQSRFLAADGVKAPGGGAPIVQVQSIALADVTGDGRTDIVAAAVEFGKLAGRDIRAPRVHVFSFDGARDFTEVWTSEHLSTQATNLSAGDLDGDGTGEFVLGGRQVYRYDAAVKTFRASATGCATCTDGVIGALGTLAEPVAATRVVPLYWTVPGRQIAEGQTLNVAMTLLSPFAEAKDVTVTVVSGQRASRGVGGPAPGGIGPGRRHRHAAAVRADGARRGRAGILTIRDRGGGRLPAGRSGHA